MSKRRDTDRDLKNLLKLSSCLKCLPAIKKHGTKWSVRYQLYTKGKRKCNCDATMQLTSPLFMQFYKHKVKKTNS